MSAPKITNAHSKTGHFAIYDETSAGILYLNQRRESHEKSLRQMKSVIDTSPPKSFIQKPVGLQRHHSSRPRSRSSSPSPSIPHSRPLSASYTTSSFDDFSHSLSNSSSHLQEGVLDMSSLFMITSPGAPSFADQRRPTSAVDRGRTKFDSSIARKRSPSSKRDFSSSDSVGSRRPKSASSVRLGVVGISHVDFHSSSNPPSRHRLPNFSIPHSSSDKPLLHTPDQLKTFDSFVQLLSKFDVQQASRVCQMALISSQEIHSNRGKDAGSRRDEDFPD